MSASLRQARVCAQRFPVVPTKLRCAALASMLLAGCGETTQTVGQTKAAAEASPAVAGPTSGTHTPTAGTRDASVAPVLTGRAGAGATGTGRAGNGSSSTPQKPKVSPPPPPPPPQPECKPATSIAAERRQLDMFLVVDTYITLPLPTGQDGWTNVRKGMTRYLDDSASDACAAGVGVGARYFGTDCTAMAYATPTTPVAALPQNADAIKQQMPTTPFTQSPTLPALQGALMYSHARATANPSSKQAVVLVSDGFYDFYCLGPEAIQSVLSGFGSAPDPSVPIYVLALDLPSLANVPALSTLLNPLTRFDGLDTIAAAGGTGTAKHIDLQADPAGFAKTMRDIQHDAQPCDYAVPDSVRADPSSMLLAVPGTTGAPAALHLVANPVACGLSGGYYLGQSANATWATLCPSSCADVKSRCAAPSWVTGCTAP